MADNRVITRFDFDNYFSRDAQAGGKVTLGGRPSLILPLSFFSYLGETASQAEKPADQFLYALGKKLGDDIFNSLTAEIRSALGIDNIAKVPFQDFLAYLNGFLAGFGFGSVKLGKEGKAIVVTHEGGVNGSDAPQSLTHFLAGFWAGVFNSFGGGKMRAAPKNSLPAESVVYLLTKEV
ncbi:MAG: hypothetical protein Kow0090_21430 [Myxococcota bacterium]